MAACLRGGILPIVVVVAAGVGVAVGRKAGRSRSPWGRLAACPLSYWEAPLRSCRGAVVRRFGTLLLVVSSACSDSMKLCARIFVVESVQERKGEKNNVNPS